MTRDEVRAELDTIVDPCSVVAGAPAGIAELGLVREISVGEGPEGAVVRVRIGLTEPGCMMGASFVVKARERLGALPGVARVDVELDHAADWHPTDADPGYQERLRVARAERRAALEAAPMIQHTVSFTWKDGTPAEDVAALAAMLAEVPARVPAVREYRFGPDLGLAAGAADFAVLAVVDDEAGLAGYLEHPFHLEVGRRIGSMAETRRRVQFALPGEEPEAAARALHAAIIAAWNARDAEGFAACFHADGVTIGFDGSESIGREAIGSGLARIFAGHPTCPYVTDVDAVRVLGGSVVVLRAVAGMAPPGTADLDPALHAKQTVVAERRGAAWAAAVFQTTPAQFHGRPEAVTALTQRLHAARR